MANPPEQLTFKQRLTRHFRQSFVAGLLFLIPVVLTIWMFTVFVGWMDSAILILPRKLGLDGTWLFKIPGIGIVLTVLIIVICGIFVRNYLGTLLVRMWDTAIHRVPIVGTFYSAVKQLVQSMFGDSSRKFGRAALIQYPREGLWSLVFVTNEQSSNEIQSHFEYEVMHVFLPTSPNPTSGYVLVVPKKDAITLNMRVEDAFKLIISGGIVRSQGGTYKVQPASKP